MVLYRDFSGFLEGMGVRLKLRNELGLEVRLFSGVRVFFYNVLRLLYFLFGI